MTGPLDEHFLKALPHSRARLPLARVHALHERLLDAVEALRRRRAGALSEADVDDYVALGWLQWHGGGLRPTAAGHALVRRLVTALQIRTEAFGAAPEPS